MRTLSQRSFANISQRIFLAYVIGVVSIAVFTAHAVAENWTQWRGPRLNCVSTEENLPAEWSIEVNKNIAWQTPLPGPAGASPIVYGDRIFLTTTNGESLAVCCLNTDGEMLWREQIDTGTDTFRGDEGNLASPSPSTDGTHLWAMFGTGALAALDLDGNRIWQFNLQDRYGEFDIQFGMASTPVLYEGRLYLQLIHGDRNVATQEARVVCIDGATGAEIWARERTSDAHEESEHSYASPTIYRDSEQAFLITHGGDYAIAHALDDGRELWRAGGINPPGNYHPTLRFVSSPSYGDNLIVVPSAKNGPTLGILPGGSGEITGTRYVAWQIPDRTPDVPTPVVYDGLVYLCRENGNLMCVDAATGEELYHERTTRDRHRASPVVADGKVYLTSRQGVVTVVRTGREFEVLAVNDLGEDIAASPAISASTIYFRTFESLIAVREE